MRRPALLLTAAMAMAGIPGEVERHAPRSPHELLRDLAQVSDREWAGIERGEAVAKVIDTDAREIAIVGAVRINGASDALISRYREIENLKRSAIVVDVGRFGQVPAADDLLKVPFEQYSLDLRNCRPGDCQVRMTAADIARFHAEVDWRASDWPVKARALWRQVLAQYAADYLHAGRSGLPVYANKREPLSVADEVSLLVTKFGFVGDYSPEFLAYLRDLGPRSPRGTLETLYWTKEDFGIRPVLRISHQAIYTPSPSIALIATNQVYADHYLDAALSVTAALDGPATDAGRSFYMIAVNRARTRSLSGVLRTFVRSPVQNRSRDAMLKILSATKRAIEKPSA